METNPNKKQTSIKDSQVIIPQDIAFVPLTSVYYDSNITSLQSGSNRKSNNFMKLRVILGVLIITCLAAGCIIAKISADKIADNYTTSLKIYIGKVNDEMSLAKISPADAKNPISKLSKPILISAFLSPFSSKYMAARTTMSIANKKIDTFNTRMNDLVAFNDYQKVRGGTLFVQEDTALKVTGGASIESSTIFLNTIKQVKISMKKIQISDDFKSISEDISKGLDDTVTAFTAMIAASNVGDKIAYKVAYSNSITVVEREIATEKLAVKYYNELSNRLVVSTNELIAYKTSIN